MAKCIGTYPKWFAYVLRWLFNRSKGCNVKLWFRGRGYRGNAFTHRQDLPLSYAKKVAIYII
jgi:hypothetical protein